MKTILDIELSEEEEEDDDYNPEKEKEVSPLPAGHYLQSITCSQWYIRVGILDKSKSQRKYSSVTIHLL